MPITITAYFLLFFTLVCSTLEQNQCIRPLRGLTKIENFETGHFQIASTTPRDRYYSTNVTYTQTHIKGKTDVFLSITYIANYQDQTGIDFSVRTIVRQSNFMALLAININARWSKAHIHYIVSSRDDFRCGTFIASDSSLLEMVPTQKQKKIRLTNSVPNPLWTSPRTKIIAYAYISGIKCEDSALNLKIFQIQTSYVNQSVSLVVNIIGNKKPIEMLYISYFAFLANGKATAKQYPPSFDFLKLSLTNKTNSIDPYGVSGMTAVNSVSLKQLMQKNNTQAAASAPPKVRLLQQHDTNKRLLAEITGNLSQIIAGFDELQLIIYKKAFEIEDVDIVSEQFLIPILTNNGGICLNFDQCKRQGGEVAAFKNGTKGCILCQIYNKTFNQQTQQCQCKDKYILQKDKCISTQEFCGVGSIFMGGTCFQLIKTKSICLQEKNQIYDEINGKCICSPQTKLQTGLSGKQACLPQCTNGAFANVDTLSCECPAGLYLKQKTKCVRCLTNQQWNPQKQECRCKTGSSLTKNGACLRCPPNAALNFEKNTCECLPGYIGKGLICRKDDSNNSVQSQNGGGITIISVEVTKP